MRKPDAREWGCVIFAPQKPAGVVLVVGHDYVVAFLLQQERHSVR